VSAATLYNWRRAYRGMDTDAAKELEELREQNARLKRGVCLHSISGRAPNLPLTVSRPDRVSRRRGLAALIGFPVCTSV